MLRRALLVGPAASVAHASETPVNGTIYILEPLRWDTDSWAGKWNSQLNSLQVELGWTVTDHASKVYMREWLIDAHILPALGDSSGITFIATHGSPDAIVLEAWDYYGGDTSLIDNRITYLNNNYASGAFFRVDYTNPAVDDTLFYGLAMDLTALGGYYNGANSLVWIAGCNTNDYQGWLGKGARVMYAYDYNVTTFGLQDDFTAFFGLLTGRSRDESYACDDFKPVEWRQAFNAYAGAARCRSTLPVQTGSPDAWWTLTPAIESFTQESDWLRTQGGKMAAFKWAFDTDTDEPWTFGLLWSPNPQMTFSSTYWGTPRTLYSNIWVPTVLPDSVYVNCDMIGSSRNSGILADGNTVPGAVGGYYYDGESGVVPNRDRYGRSVTAPDDPLAVSSTFLVQGGVASWYTLRERGTAEYRVEGRVSGDAAWETVATEPSGVGAHTVGVPGGYSHYRLVEIEAEGGLVFHGTSAPARERPSWVEAGDAPRDRPEVPLPGPIASATAQLFVAFAPDTGSYYQFMQGYWVPTWSAYNGWLFYDPRVELVPMSLSEDERVTYIRNKIDEYYQTYGAKYFLLVGDANDYRELDGPLVASYWTGAWAAERAGVVDVCYPNGPTAGQPTQNSIPTFSYLNDNQIVGDGLNAGYPYWFTDQDYADLDGDLLPDVVVTRWPAKDWQELEAINYKAMYHNCHPGVGGSCTAPTTAGVYVLAGDIEHDDVGDSLLAVQQVQLVESEVPSSLPIFEFWTSAEPDPVLRNYAVRDFWNEGTMSQLPPELVVLMSSKSNPYSCGEVFNKYFYTCANVQDRFDASWLTTAYTPVVIGGTCGTANFAHTEADLGTTATVCGLLGRPMSEDFLFTWGKGAVAWIGPTTGSWQHANGVITQRIVRKVYENPYRSVAESWMLAMREVLSEYTDDIQVWETARSYAFLGDPVSRLNISKYDPVGADLPDRGDGDWRVRVLPNPARDGVAFSFDVPWRDRVKLVVYDVTGRRVTVVMDEVLDAGGHRRDWNRRDEHGKRASAGMYFYRARLATAGTVATGRFVLVN